jgi:hypothetical protein
MKLPSFRWKKDLAVLKQGKITFANSHKYIHGH